MRKAQKTYQRPPVTQYIAAVVAGYYATEDTKLARLEGSDKISVPIIADTIRMLTEAMVSIQFWTAR